MSKGFLRRAMIVETNEESAIIFFRCEAKSNSRLTLYVKYAVSRENTFCSIYIKFTAQFTGIQDRATRVSEPSSFIEVKSSHLNQPAHHLGASISWSRSRIKPKNWLPSLPLNNQPRWVWHALHMAICHEYPLNHGNSYDGGPIKAHPRTSLKQPNPKTTPLGFAKVWRCEPLMDVRSLGRVNRCWHWRHTIQRSSSEVSRSCWILVTGSFWGACFSSDSKA